MKIQSPVEVRKARIEIIPLIDIMFFLLASFMAVSLSMTQMRGIGVNLPAVTTSQPEQDKEFVAVSVLENGEIFLEKEPIDLPELSSRVQQLVREKKDLRVYIKADKNVAHGVVLGVLDTLRRAGAKKTAFEVKVQSVATPVAESVPAQMLSPAPGVSPTRP